VYEKRCADYQGLWRGIRVERSGRKLEAVYAFAFVKALPGGWQGGALGEIQAIKEIASDVERSWTIVESDRQMREWEDRLIEAAEPASLRLAESRASDVFARSSALIRIAEEAVTLPCASPSAAVEVRRNLYVYRIHDRQPKFEEAFARLASHPDWSTLESRAVEEVLHIMVALMLEREAIENGLMVAL
jgi:hypothetical protein